MKESTPLTTDILQDILFHENSLREIFLLKQKQQEKKPTIQCIPNTKIIKTTKTTKITKITNADLTDFQQTFKNVITDSRKINHIDSRTYPQTLFVALTGDRFEGSDFVVNLIKKGISTFICPLHVKKKIISELDSYCQKNKVANVVFFFVKDTTIAYGQIAKWKLSQYKGIKIAITGSAGKTSLKELLGKLLSLKYKTFVSEKNTNNLIGVPQNIFNIADSYDYYVFELGMNHSGEIKQLCNIVQPHLTVITNVLPAHIGNFKTIKDIARAKAEIFLHMTYVNDNKNLLFNHSPNYPNGYSKITFLNADNKYFSFLKRQAQRNKLQVIPFKPSQLKKETWIDANFKLITELCWDKERYLYTGRDSFILEHLSCLLAFQSFLHISPVIFKTFLNQLSTARTLRSEEKNHNPKIIDDAYNANPISMINAVKSWLEIIATTYYKTSQQIRIMFVLGDILELGEKSKKYHRLIEKNLSKALRKMPLIIQENVDLVFLGKEMLLVHQNIKTKNKKYFMKREELLFYLKKTLTYPLKKVYFFKASNGVKLQLVINEFVEQILKNQIVVSYLY